MKLTVKTLKGGKFGVECETSHTVREVKGIIESTNSDLIASNLKLIHSGKVLKDDTTVESCGIKPNDFLVVMVTKAKKAAAAKAPVPAAATAAVTEKASTASGSDATTKSTSNKKATESATATSSSSPPTDSAAPEPESDAPEEFPAEVLSSLTGMGFPEAEVRHCLRVANGNPDMAVEFLTNGIPPGMQPGEQGAVSGGASSSSGGGGTLSALRSHPQFDALRQLVQSNPAMLQTVLTQIGQQQPELLTEINANQEAFLQMMNEPITETSRTSSGSSSNSGSSSSSTTSGGADTGMPGIPPGMMEGMANPAQMAQLIQNMSADELNQMATMMGLSPEQLRTTAQMLGQIPPEQLQQYMMQAMQGGGGGGSIEGMMDGGSGGGGGGPGGPQVLRLTQEEMAAVDRLADMGFDRTEAAQAYLACDKDEALAANLLMDSMGDGGFGFGGAASGGGGSGGGSNSGGNDGDDMYD
mmetsp:Transcript_5601/g.6218  ORF Transcript_5601/g.6218 Transcript_5601/m.6218 type:complete len:471 (+) Transcript_5601:74-1486(+)